MEKLRRRLDRLEQSRVRGEETEWRYDPEALRAIATDPEAAMALRRIGEAQADYGVDSPEALAVLERESPVIERVLAAAGFDALGEEVPRGSPWT